MPLYEYECEACQHRLEEIQSFADEPLKKCPNCKKDKLVRLITGGLGFSIKGGTSKTTTLGNAKKPGDNSQARIEAMGGRYIPMDSTEQKFEERMKELKGSGEI